MTRSSEAEMSSEPQLIRSARFRREREPGWRRLVSLLDRVEVDGRAALSFEDARELTALYRQTVNSLSVAREVSLDASLLAYLEALAARAYLALYAPQATLSGLARRFFTQGAPRAMRASWPHLLVAGGLMLLGGLVAYALVASDPSWYYSFVPEGLANGRGPGASTERLRESIYGNDGASGLASFATYLFSHNTQVAIFAFALGIVAAVLTGLLVLYNGAVLGAFVAIHVEKDLGFDIFAWLSIHGVTELSAIVVAAAGGLVLGQAALFPGQRSRAEALRAVGRQAVHLAVVAAIMLLAAAILEGFFRQLVQDPWWRLGIGWGIGLLWLLWFVLAGRTGRTSHTARAGRREKAS